MSVRLKTFLLIIWIAALLIMLFMMKKKRSNIRYILPWLFLDLIMCLLTIFPGILTRLCSVVGIKTPSNMMFFFGMLFLIMIIFSMVLTIAKLNEEVRDLSQRLALFEGTKQDTTSTDNKDNSAGENNDSQRNEENTSGKAPTYR